MHELKLLPSKFRWYGVGRAAAYRKRKRKRQGICSAIKFRLILTFLIYY